MKNSLVVVLFISSLIEIGLGFGILIKPEMLAGTFGIAALDQQTYYLTAIIGWFCLLTAAFAVLSMVWVHKARREGLVLALVLGLFWLGIGLHLGATFARPQHYVLGAAKGFVIIVLAILNLRQRPV